MEGDELRKELPDQDSRTQVWDRLSAYAYLSAPERREYLAVMRVFCGTLLADLAVPDVLAKLAQSGTPADAEEVREYEEVFTTVMIASGMPTMMSRVAACLILTDSGSLPADEALAAVLDAETLTARLEQLVRWGNVLRSTHTVRAGSIAEYQRSRSRYQLSKLGERVQRDADEVLAGADAAREVSGELLTLVERGLGEIAAMVAVPSRAARPWR
ncbi:DUF2397 family protein [Streptomyces sp. NPDC057746]|uniref:DUF2397 family protein n=1 Tax=Streptomyces sp. NPDC057746 TaxID=3346237 RepID=UPI0036B6392F